MEKIPWKIHKESNCLIKYEFLTNSYKILVTDMKNVYYEYLNEDQLKSTIDELLTSKNIHVTPHNLLLKLEELIERKSVIDFSASTITIPITVGEISICEWKMSLTKDTLDNLVYTHITIPCFLMLKESYRDLEDIPFDDPLNIFLRLLGMDSFESTYNCVLSPKIHGRRKKLKRQTIFKPQNVSQIPKPE
jgi:hypothetical protein